MHLNLRACRIVVNAFSTTMGRTQGDIWRQFGPKFNVPSKKGQRVKCRHCSREISATTKNCATHYANCTLAPRTLGRMSPPSCTYTTPRATVAAPGATAAPGTTDAAPRASAAASAHFASSSSTTTARPTPVAVSTLSAAASAASIDPTIVDLLHAHVWRMTAAERRALDTAYSLAIHKTLTPFGVHANKP